MMSEVALPEGYKVYRVEFTKRAFAFVAANDRDELAEHAEDGDLDDLGLLEDDFGWEFDGSFEAKDAPHAILSDGEVMTFDDWLDAEAEAGRIVDVPAAVPDWMRLACSKFRWCCGGVVIKLDVSGDEWLSDGSSAIKTGGTADGSSKAKYNDVFAAILAQPRGCAEEGERTAYPYVRGDQVVDIGGSRFACVATDLVRELYPASKWEKSSFEHGPAVAVVDGQPVAVVMPVRD
jgi:hypothetical protein